MGNRSKSALIAASAIAGLALAACGSSTASGAGVPLTPHTTAAKPTPKPKPKPTAPKTKTLTIDFVFYDKASAANNCVTTGYYSNIIVPGAPVVTKDQRGVIIGSASLGKGSSYQGGAGCLYIVHIHNVPTTATQYSTDVARQGAVTVSRQELQSRLWETGIQFGKKGE